MGLSVVVYSVIVAFQVFENYAYDMINNMASKRDPPRRHLIAQASLGEQDCDCRKFNLDSQL